MIPFNKPIVMGTETKYFAQVLRNRRFSGDGEFTRRCTTWLEQRLGAQKVLLTTSGTTALDMALLLCDLRPGDEVILPSFTFSSTATAAVLAGAKLVFVDIRPDTMNIDERKIEAAITGRTRAIIVMHYAGVACEMDAITDIARRHDLFVVEDAAQAMLATYKGQQLGTIGDFGCFSFHETKNFSMGEGGALVIKDPRHNERAEILREKGTNRAKFWRGEVDKYTWVDFGDSYLPGELNAAYLWGQLERADEITADRLRSWQTYHNALSAIASDKIELPLLPAHCKPNGHIYWLKLSNLNARTEFLARMKRREIGCVFHYVPLHSAPAGKKYGRLAGVDEHTTKESERLARLPLYYGMTDEEKSQVVAEIREWLA